MVAAKAPSPAVHARQAAFTRAVRLMQSPRARAFNLDAEPASMREAYGSHRFGQSLIPSEKTAPVSGGKTAPVDV
jgi:hypothetical protein